jgi:hypothetical protein
VHDPPKHAIELDPRVERLGDEITRQYEHLQHDQALRMRSASKPVKLQFDNVGARLAPCPYRKTPPILIYSTKLRRFDGIPVWKRSD